MKSVMIHQPEYLPWNNLFVKMAFADVFISLDTVQYSRRSFQNRNEIKTRNGTQWLTVPLKHAPRDEIIMNMRIDNSEEWRERHSRLISDSYSATNYYREIFVLLEPLYCRQWEKLHEVNDCFTVKIAEVLNITPEFIRSSELTAKGKGSELILNLCLELDATRYISGVGASTYLDEKKFKAENIDIVYIPPLKFTYDQIFSDQGFISDLSIIDFLFNTGISESQDDFRRKISGIEI